METLAHGVAGSLGGALAMAVLYPLDQIKTIQQLKTQEQALEAQEQQEQQQEQEQEQENQESKQDKPQPELPDASSKSAVLDMAHFVRDALAILKQQKWRVYQGFGSTQIAMGGTNFVYFVCYNGLKNALLKRLRRSDPAKYPASSSAISPMQNLLLSCVAGILNVYMTAPVWVANMRLKSKEADKYKGFFDCLYQIGKHEGVGSLWSGTMASLVLVSNPVIHYVSYERMKTALMHRHRRALTSMEIFAIGASAKFFTTMVTYPLQVVQSRMRVQERQEALAIARARREGTAAPPKKGGVLACLRDIYQHDGMQGLYAGVEAKLLQTVLTAALMLMTYEKLLSLILVALRAQKKKQVVANARA